MSRLIGTTFTALTTIALWQSTCGICCAERTTIRVVNDLSEEFLQAHDAFKSDEFQIAAKAFAAIANRNGVPTPLSNEKWMVIEARYWLAESQLHGHAYRLAKQNYRKYLAIAPPGRRVAWALLRMGQTSRKLGHYEEAERYFKEFLKRYPNHERAHRAYEELPNVLLSIAYADYRAYLTLNDNEGLDAAYGRLSEHARSFPSDKNRDQVRYYLGQIFLLKNDLKSARASFSECLESISRDTASSRDRELLPKTHFKLGEVYVRLGQLSTAEKHFETIINGWPKGKIAAIAAEELAKCRPPLEEAPTEEISLAENVPSHDATQSHDERLSAKSIPQDPMPVKASENDNRAAEPARLRPTTAAVVLESPSGVTDAARTAGPDDLLRTAQGRLQKREIEAAIDILRHALRVFPSSQREPEVESLLGDCFAVQRNFPAARRHWTRARRSTHTSSQEGANMLAKVAHSYRIQGDYLAALREYLRLATVYEKELDSRRQAYDDAAYCYRQIGDRLSAERLMRLASRRLQDERAVVRHTKRQSSPSSPGFIMANRTWTPKSRSNPVHH